MGADVFEHKTRKMIFNHISTHPGVSFSIIKRVLDLSDSTLRYHLNFLESHHEVKSVLESGNRCYYPIQTFIFNSHGEMPISHRLNNTQERLMDTIRRYPGITQKDLILRTGMKRITVANNIKKLLDFGVLRKEPNGKFISYFYISDKELQKKIMKRLMIKFLNYEIDERTFLALKKKLER
ncbi:winged helix-turn-helix transcriptional regulator [[Eubacterium] cellulosolvens]